MRLQGPCTAGYACPAGSTTSTPAAFICTAGTFSDPGASSCTNCSAGRYGSSSGLSSASCSGLCQVTHDAPPFCMCLVNVALHTSLTWSHVALPFSRSLSLSAPSSLTSSSPLYRSSLPKLSHAQMPPPPNPCRLAHSVPQAPRLRRPSPAAPGPCAHPGPPMTPCFVSLAPTVARRLVPVRSAPQVLCRPELVFVSIPFL
jgi:hypothetical protein